MSRFTQGIIVVFMVLFLLISNNVDAQDKPPIDEDDLRMSESNRLPDQILSIYDPENPVRYLTINKVRLDRTDTVCFVVVEYVGKTVDVVKVVRTSMQCD